MINERRSWSCAACSYVCKTRCQVRDGLVH